MSQAALEARLKHLIVERLMLEDVAPQEIDSSAPLFGEGLGLDSIDALELSLALQHEFGVRVAAEDENNQARFFSVATLAAFVKSEIEARGDTVPT